MTWHGNDIIPPSHYVKKLNLISYLWSKEGPFWHVNPTVCAKALQPVYVSRTDPNSRKKTISEIKRRATSGGKWPHIVIFPEG